MSWKRGGYQHLWRARKSGIFIVLSMGKSPKDCSQNTGWSNWRGSSNSPCRFGWWKLNENARVQHLPSVLRIKVSKKNLKEDEIILSVEFSKNYENKQHHEIQSAYVGHKIFTILTAVCYFHTSISIENSVIDEESNLVKFLVVIISNETKHDHNMAFSNNNKLIRMVKDMAPNISMFHFWSNGCAGQFRSQFMFCFFLLLSSRYHINMELWRSTPL